MKNDCPLTKALVVLQQQGIPMTKTMTHNITSLGQTTSNGTIISIFRLNMSKVCSAGKLKFSKHSELQWYETKHFLASFLAKIVRMKTIPHCLMEAK